MSLPSHGKAAATSLAEECRPAYPSVGSGAVEAFLRHLLRSGLPMSSNDVKAAAQSAGGWSWRTVHRAAKRVRVSVVKEAGSLTGAWHWTLAAPDGGSFEADSDLVTVEDGTFEAVTDGTGTGDFDHEAFEERAAIMEFDGGLTREDAERIACIALGPQRLSASSEVQREELDERSMSASLAAG